MLGSLLLTALFNGGAKICHSDFGLASSHMLRINSFERRHCCTERRATQHVSSVQTKHSSLFLFHKFLEQIPLSFANPQVRRKSWPTSSSCRLLRGMLPAHECEYWLWPLLYESATVSITSQLPGTETENKAPGGQTACWVTCCVTLPNSCLGDMISTGAASASLVPAHEKQPQCWSRQGTVKATPRVVSGESGHGQNGRLMGQEQSGCHQRWVDW